MCVRLARRLRRGAGLQAALPAYGRATLRHRHPLCPAQVQYLTRFDFSEYFLETRERELSVVRAWAGVCKACSAGMAVPVQ